MRSVLFSVFIVFAQVSGGQDSSAIQKLQGQFRQVYYDHDEPDANFFNRLYRASIVVFNLQNDPFFDELTTRKKKNKSIPNDSLAGKIFDTVVLWFTQNHLWDNNPDAPSRYRTIFTRYNEKMCPCATTKLLSKDYRIDQSDLGDCMTMLAMDTSYANTLRRDAGSTTVNELMNISQLAGVYLFEKCPALYRFFLMIPRDEVRASASVRTRWFFHDAEKMVVDLYTIKSFAKLAEFFPAYKSYTAEISPIKELIAKKELISTIDRKELAPGKTEITKTYYSNESKKLVIHGQVIYVFSEDNVDGSLLSLRFIPTSKIRNLKDVLKEIEEGESLAPPPIMDLQDTKIEIVPADSLRKKKGQ
jgi:hypothetical protein